MFIQRDSALQFISKSSGFFPSSSWWTLERNVYPESKLLLMLVRETIWSKISYPSKLFFPPQRTYTKCSSISPFFMTHISVNIHLMQFSTKYTHSFSLRNYANCLRHEAEKTQYCTYPQKVHNLERQPASLKILTPYRNFRTQSTYNVQGRHKKRRSPRLPEGKWRLHRGRA